MLAWAACFAMTVIQAEPSDKKTKEEKQVEKEKKSDEKNAARYEKIKEFALNKYKTDTEFRDGVDRAFDEQMRKHSEEAYARNVGRTSKMRTVHEDTWREHHTLYDNLLVQDHVNRIGQRLVPADSEKLYAFKVVPNPTPMARALSTGTVYVSTGLISLLDSEAQLSYVLAHEMAHIHLDHWRETSMMVLGEQEYNEAQANKAKKIGMIGAIAGAAVGGIAGNSINAALSGAAVGAGGGFIAGMLMNRQIHHVEWDKVQEDQADELAFKAVLGASYDVREVPRMYASLDKAASRDARVQLGFLGRRNRIKQRVEKAENLIANSLKAEIELKAKNGFLSSSAEHRNLMAELKRDNGILAFYHDMFDMARTNLGDAVAIRNNDPAAHYFYAKTLKLVGRTEEEGRLAKESFFKATKADTLKQNYGAHLHLALMMSREKGTDVKQIAGELDTYVTNYAHSSVEQEMMNRFPPNLDSIYEYMTIYGGDPNWRPKVPDLQVLKAYRVLSELAPPAAPVTRETAAADAAAPKAAPETVTRPVANVINNALPAAATAIRAVQTAPKKK